ncbi:MAG: hypothetical protein KDA57_18480, partial [Planctomycetales bacterium]|nr:hypothetical protein [Planctomycetales bacterium]
MSAIVRVSAPSRLHFGLLRFAQQAGLSFGGLGMTIREPRTIVELQLAPEWQAAGPLAERALAFAKRAVQSCETYLDSAFHIRVCKAPPPHSGLGTGTQLALAVARGVRELLQLPALDAAGLAACVGRGKRSAVGSHGFLQGGLIWETGRPAAASLGVLARRVEIPAHWRVLLCSLPQQPGLHGEREAAAFESLPPVPKEVTAELLALAEEAILPAAEAANFATFADAVHDYGRLAGSCFTAVQGSSFASPAIGHFVDQLREHGIRGVGQSSWGPTVFALAADAAQAATLAERAR